MYNLGFWGRATSNVEWYPMFWQTLQLPSSGFKKCQLQCLPKHSITINSRWSSSSKVGSFTFNSGCEKVRTRVTHLCGEELFSCTTQLHTHTHILTMTTPFVCQNGLYSFHLSISYLWFLSPAFLYHPIYRSVFLVLLTLSCFLMPPEFLHRDLSVLTETETLTKHTKLKCEHLKMTQTYIRENNTVLYKIILEHFIRKKYFFKTCYRTTMKTYQIIMPMTSLISAPI